MVYTDNTTTEHRLRTTFALARLRRVADLVLVRPTQNWYARISD